MTTNLLLEWAIKIAILLGVVLTAVAYLTLLERKVMSWIQLRVGPNRVGPWGLLQPAADGLKMIFKEDIIPLNANKWLYIVAPALGLVPALMALIVIPFGDHITLFGRTIPLHVTHMDVGLLYLFALTSLGVYGIVLGGWASNSKYSLMGGLRSSAQMISYELALGLAIVSVLIWAGSLDLSKIAELQAGYKWGFIPRWNVFRVPFGTFGFIIFYIAALAETNRTPFDLPEADSELVAGYHTEYSAMKFVMFQMSEYINLITSTSVSTTLFLGGWNGPGVERFPILGVGYFLAKVLTLILIAMWIRFTVPRFRYDQLMRFGWKFLMPAAIFNVILTATFVLLIR